MKTTTILKSLLISVLTFLLCSVYFLTSISVHAVAATTTTTTTVTEQKSKPGALPEGFKGVSWSQVIPANKVTFIGYDPQSFLDDFAYVSAVPASVFYSKSANKLISNPLLFYERPVGGDTHKKMLNASQGIEYLMDDIITCAGGELDNIQFVNVPQSDMELLKSKWQSKTYASITAETIYEIAAQIAVYNWEYTDVAVIAVAENRKPAPLPPTSGIIDGSVYFEDKIRTNYFTGYKSPSPVQPNFHDFVIAEPYKYVTAKMYWHNQDLPATELAARGKDLDLQLYDKELGEVAASENWNVLTGATEDVGSYVYHHGTWSAAVTYMPTEPLLVDGYIGYYPEAVNEYTNMVYPACRATPNPGSPTTEYTIEYTIYPGIDLEIPEPAPFACTNATFKLTWSPTDTNCNLGLLVRGPSGAEVGRSMSTTASETEDGAPANAIQKIELALLGEGKYTISIINLVDYDNPIKFKLEYSWNQSLDRELGDYFGSAAEAAILASTLNAPLLYTPLTSLSQATEYAIDLLGVKSIYLVDLGNHEDKLPGLIDTIKSSRTLLQPKLDVTLITDYETIYDKIRERTGQNLADTQQVDVVFSTLNPWSYTYLEPERRDEGPDGDHPGGLTIGPATYAAAHHGTPLLIVDLHPELSCSQAWFTNFWLDAYAKRPAPSVGCMTLAGRQIYNFLNRYGFDREGQESILTVAGQFDIGISWERALVGPALSGRIIGSPVDAACWLTRSIFYPKLIFANPAVNPALDEHGGKRIMGSGYPMLRDRSREVEVTHPVLQTWVSYLHRFNERGSEYWGCDYVTITGITPFKSPSDNEIDDGVNAIHGKPGCYWPDISTSEAVPFYLEKCGYSSVFSTNFEATMENLNRGAIMWFEVMHGSYRGGGVVGFWNENQVESNPWRGYESGGNTYEPDTVTMSKNTGLDYQPALGPKRHDGVVIAILTQETQSKAYFGLDFDFAMANLHSVGFSAGSCLISNTYLHLALIRHGSVFQVIDPWLTSWYASFAMEMFVRHIALGYSVGEAYEFGISHVGIEYLINNWWWDIFENLVYFGDPDLRVYTPKYSWTEPLPLPAGAVVDGHSIFGARKHPHAIQDTTAQEYMVYAVAVAIAIAIIGAAAWHNIRRRQKRDRLNQ
jgi:hypothetical protein